MTDATSSCPAATYHVICSAPLHPSDQPCSFANRSLPSMNCFHVSPLFHFSTGRSLCHLRCRRTDCVSPGCDSARVGGLCVVFEREVRLYVYALLPSRPLIVVAHCSTGPFLLPCFLNIGRTLARWFGASPLALLPGIPTATINSCRFRDRTVTDLFVSLLWQRAGSIWTPSSRFSPFPLLFFSRLQVAFPNPITLSSITQRSALTVTG